MAQFDLYIDTVAGTLVTGPANPTVAIMPRLTQGDTISLRIYLLARTVTYPVANPFSIINNANLSLKVAIGPKDGTPGSEPQKVGVAVAEALRDALAKGSLQVDTGAGTVTVRLPTGEGLT